MNEMDSHRIVEAGKKGQKQADYRQHEQQPTEGI